ncbi:3-ketodihydrosphingosine reductase-like, partial [Pollicipes pollicipes]|uniref:3-ketodihydrosphingosine reductase-like n=1 Tax=Pollicipes pollicipes TaxID=41117 RepID=UPI0018855B3E
VLVTGGSSGIGRSLALLAARHGAHVTLVARDAARLEARAFLCLPVDVAGDAAAVRNVVARAEQELGPIHLAACCAGFALAQRFEEMPLETYRRLMDVNYFGVVNVLHAVVPAMKARREGRLALVSSLGGVVGLWGFAGYCASKYALVGLGQTLAQELKPYGVGVTLCYPPDTDTAGFEEENRTKPEETRLICATAGLFSPDEVAAQLLRDMMRGNITSTVGSEGHAYDHRRSGHGSGQLGRPVSARGAAHAVVPPSRRLLPLLLGRHCARLHEQARRKQKERVMAGAGSTPLRRPVLVASTADNRVTRHVQRMPAASKLANACRSRTSTSTTGPNGFC